jgi:hypothetical protein
LIRPSRKAVAVAAAVVAVAAAVGPVAAAAAVPAVAVVPAAAVGPVAAAVAVPGALVGAVLELQAQVTAEAEGVPRRPALALPRAPADLAAAPLGPAAASVAEALELQRGLAAGARAAAVTSVAWAAAMHPSISQVSMEP